MRNLLIAAAFALTAFAMPVHREFIAVDPTQSPARVRGFQLTVPLALTSLQYPLNTDFVAGIEFTYAPSNVGWFVSSGSYGLSQTGYFSLIGGQHLVSPLPFAPSSTLGGLSLLPDGDGFYWCGDVLPATGFELYRISMSGTWDFLCSLSAPELVCPPAASGLATNRLNGKLYALDNSNDALFEVNPETGVCVRVGQGLGVVVSGNGGLDFTDNFSFLVMVTNGGRVYSVDVQTGLAGTYYGQLPFAATSLASQRENAVVRGHIDLHDYVGPTEGISVRFEFRQAGTSGTPTVATASLDSDGNFSFPFGISEGNYDVLAKASHWLKQEQMNIHVSNMIGQMSFSLRNGDCDDDNEVGISDYALLSSAYNTELGSPLFDPRADLNGDQAVDIADYSILSSMYGQSGDE